MISTCGKISPLKLPSQLLSGKFNEIKRNYFFERFFPPSKNSIEKVVPYTPEQFFDMVIDVENYQNFLPWCQKSRLLKTSYSEPYKFEAELSIGYKFLKETYISVIHFKRPNFIRVSAAESTMFSKLLTEWHFKPGPTSNSSYLEFSIAFQLMNPFHHHTLNLFMTEMAETMTSSFENRAEFLYGKRHMDEQESTKQPTTLVSTKENSHPLFPVSKEPYLTDAKKNILEHYSLTKNIDTPSSTNIELTLTEWSKIFQKVIELKDQQLLTEGEAKTLKRLARKQNKELAIMFLAFEKELSVPNFKDDRILTFIESLREFLLEKNV